MLETIEVTRSEHGMIYDFMRGLLRPGKGHLVAVVGIRSKRKSSKLGVVLRNTITDMRDSERFFAEELIDGTPSDTNTTHKKQEAENFSQTD